MSLTPLDPFQSLVMLAWRRADYLVHQMVRALGLGLLPCKPFLLRPVHARLAADLARFEALTRRLLVLMVLEKGLSQYGTIRRSSTAAPRPARPAQVASLKPRRCLTRPAFRLAESTGRAGGAPPPRRLKGGPRPRILRLDQQLPPPEPWEYPVLTEDLVPSQLLIRRLVALNQVFVDPATHLARMARHLIRSRAGPGARLYRLAALPPAARASRRTNARPSNSSTMKLSTSWTISTRPSPQSRAANHTSRPGHARVGRPFWKKRLFGCAGQGRNIGRHSRRIGVIHRIVRHRWQHRHTARAWAAAQEGCELSLRPPFG